MTIEDQFCSIGQMEALEKFGININCDVTKFNWVQMCDEFRVTSGITGNGICRAFSVIEMLMMMPNTVNNNSKVYFFKLEKPILTNQYVCSYELYSGDECLFHSAFTSLKDAVYDLLVKLVHAGLLKTENK